MRTKLAQDIRNARRAAGLTQKQLGRRLGLEGRAVYRWESDDSSPTKRHRRELVLAIQAVNPQAASALASAIAEVEKGVAPRPSAGPAIARPAVAPAEALERAIYQAADELDVPVRRLRGVLSRLFTRMRLTQLALEDTVQLFERQSAERT
ncbi:MAG: helix-turn-helix transcriptional regulator [Polyangiaceae bacterium]